MPTGGGVLFSQEIALFSKLIAVLPVSSGLMSPLPLMESKDFDGSEMLHDDVLLWRKNSRNGRSATKEALRMERGAFVAPKTVDIDW